MPIYAWNNNMWISGAFSDIGWLDNIFFSGHGRADSWKNLPQSSLGSGMTLQWRRIFFLHASFHDDFSVIKSKANNSRFLWKKGLHRPGFEKVTFNININQLVFLDWVCVKRSVLCLAVSQFVAGTFTFIWRLPYQKNYRAVMWNQKFNSRFSFLVRFLVPRTP